MPSHSSTSQRLVDFPESSVITKPVPGEEFVRIRQGQLTKEEPADESDGILTRINQKPISGRTQVTALRQTSGKRLNISPVFVGKDESSNNGEAAAPRADQDVALHEDSNVDVGGNLFML